MATRTTNKQIQLTGWSSFQQVSKIISSLLEKMKNVFSVNEDSISKTLSEFKEEQLAKFDNGFIAKAYLYTRRI